MIADRIVRLAPRVRILAAAALLLVLGAPALAAQQPATGRITGRILDGATGQGLADVGVQVVGSPLGAQSGLDGRFTIANVPAGGVALQVRRLGYQPKTVTGIAVSAGQTVEQSITLSAATVVLQATVVTASAERGTVNDALDAQKTATGIVNAVTSEQIAKSPDSDAAQAVQRVSGVTVQGGRYVFVRGLGERYTTTQLNGTRIPSPEPEKKVVPLDMFPSGLLQTITTQKTFTPDLQGDFSGAQVDIRTREFPSRRQFTYALTMGANTAATGSDVLRGINVGGEAFAMAGSGRQMPDIVRLYTDLNYPRLNQNEVNLLVGSQRNAWTPNAKGGLMNTSMSASVGGNDPVFGQRIGYLLSGTYSLTQDVRADNQRALANRGSQPGETVELDRFDGEVGNAGVLWGGIANVSTLIGGGTRLMLNNTLNRTADHEARIERGYFESIGLDAEIRKMQYVERSVRSNQLAAEHQVGSRHRLDWAVTNSAVSRDEPDRSEFISAIEHDTPGGPEKLRWLNTGNGGAVRTYGELDESSNEARANYQLDFAAFGRQHLVKVGGLFRGTDRESETVAFSSAAPSLTQAQRELAPEQIFDGRFASADFWQYVALGQGGSYAADDRLGAGYGMVELALSDRFRFIGGARFESSRLTLDAKSTLGTPIRVEKQWDDVLPSAALNVKLTEGQNVRFSVSRTLARPEYRELAPITSRDVLNADFVEGNQELERTRIGNADVRWEWYPNAGEIVSVGVFAKQFDQPIERVYRAGNSSNRTIVYVNADEATNYGIELELRKNLGFLAGALDPFSLFTNLTFMESDIRLGDQQLAATNASRRMVGQAPYVVNAGVTYTSRSGGTSATLLYNRTGERIDAAGDEPLPDVIQQPRDLLDLSLRFPIHGSLSGRLDARNLLDAPYEVTQGTVVRERYLAGRVVQVGFQWRP